MTVSPGFGGQAFRGEVVPKIVEARRIRDAEGYRCLIEVDGGVSPGTAKIVGDAGAELLVAGSAVFGKADRAAAIAEIARLASA
jgi:ribulose-phosphate 3-epimerase